MLETLFNPKTIAVIGASRSSNKAGHIILTNLIEGGFEGSIIPVNSNADSILGLKCYEKIQQYPDKIDLSIIVVPKLKVKDEVRFSIEKGAKSIVVVSVGFKESSTDGAELENQIAEMCKLRGVRLLGPNCLGFISTSSKINAFFGGKMPRSGSVSMFSQSSSISSIFLDQIKNSHLGISKLINFGNKAELTEIDFLKYLAHDEQTRIIIGYLESISSGDDFVKAAEVASSKKPVIILKSATTDSGRKAVAAHSGELLGADTAYGAAFKRSGVIRAESLDQLHDITASFSLQPLPKGDRILVISNAGGPGIMAVDAIERSGLNVAHLGQKNIEMLRAELPESTTIYNPIDILGDAGPDRYSMVIKAALADKNVDAVVVLIVERFVNKPMEIAKALIESCNGIKPVMVSFIGGTDNKARSLLKPGGVPDFESPERAVAALKAMYEYVAWRQRPPRIVSRFKVNRRRVERIIFRHLRSKRHQINSIKAKDILAAYDFQIPNGSLTTSVEEAIEAAEWLGYPVALKIISSDIIHKKDIGGVKLNISDREAIRDAYDLMMLRVRQRAPKAEVEGIYVEKMLGRGFELVLGMNRDPQFGPMLMFGLGGIFVEVMKDVAFHLAPITYDEAIMMLRSTKSYQLLIESRGKERVDLQVIAHALQKISQLVTDFPQIAELEINPLIVGDSGSDPYVADAKINLMGF